MVHNVMGTLEQSVEESNGIASVAVTNWLQNREKYTEYPDL